MHNNINIESSEQKLAQLASSVSKDPESWEGWLCLRVRGLYADPQQTTIHQEDSLSVLETVLEKTENIIYCYHNSIYAVCKKIDASLLEETGRHICGHNTEDEHYNYNCDYKIYNLTQDATAFIEDVRSKGNLFNLFPQTSGTEENKGTTDSSHTPPLFQMERTQNSFSPEAFSKKTKVLLVDDDPIIRWMVRTSLKDECELVTAPNAHKAYGVFSAFTPDVVLLDINLPDKNGYAVLEWIKNNDPGACVIMLSSHDHVKNIINALQEGASGFIGKPFLKDKLVNYIRKQAI